MKSFLHIALRHTVLAALMIALLALPFVHRAGAEPVSSEISQFISMGGKLADICGERSDHKASGCESCAICAVVVVSAHSGHMRPAFAPNPLDIAHATHPAARLTALHFTPPVRAPPAQLT